MDPKFISLNQQIGKIVKSPADQGRIVATVFAMAAAAAAPLPSSQLDNVPAYFAAQVYPSASEAICNANESVVFGAKSAMEYMQIFWKMRYNAAFPASIWGYDNNGMNISAYNLAYRGHRGVDTIGAYLGAASEMSPEYYEFCNKFQNEIVALLPDVMFIMIGSKAILEAELAGGNNATTI